MAPPMLEIAAETAGKPAQATPHLLPCRIHHSGPVGAADAFWEPKQEDGKPTAYFRGRKLHGQTMRLPDGYRGVVGECRDSPREQARQQGGSLAAAALDVTDVDATPAEQAAARQRLDTGALDVRAQFDAVVVWRHQSTADAATDAYVRGVDEWLALSDKIHAYD